MLKEAQDRDLDLGEVLILRGFLTPERWAEVYRTSELYASRRTGSRAPVMLAAFIAVVCMALLIGALFAFGILKLG